MFRIGEFSKIAQVSGRLLRYYDQIGLLKPIKIDQETGYRSYSATQLPRLNQILTLKELGLTLDQIAQLLSDHITPEEIRGMFLMKKAQSEQALQAEQRRLRTLESRLQQIDHQGQPSDFDVVVKSIPRQRFFALRDVFSSIDSVRTLVKEIHDTVIKRSEEIAPGAFVVVILSDVFEPEQLDFELGYVTQAELSPPLMLADGRTLTMRELPGIATMATIIRLGPPDSKHVGYSALGSWIEANDYRVSGPGREMFLQLPFEGREEEAVIEIQFPIEPLALTDVRQ